jgi:hypothetical protein
VHYVCDISAEMINHMIGLKSLFDPAYQTLGHDLNDTEVKCVLTTTKNAVSEDVLNTALTVILSVTRAESWFRIELSQHDSPSFRRALALCASVQSHIRCVRASTADVN